MADNKISLPSSGGGLVRYFDEYRSKIELKPEYVIAAIVVIIILGFVLRSWNSLGV